MPSRKPRLNYIPGKLVKEYKYSPEACLQRQAFFSIGVYFNQLGFGKEIGKESSWNSLTNYKLV